MPKKKSDQAAIDFFSQLMGTDLTEKFEEEKSKVVEPADFPILQAEGVLLHLQSTAKALQHKQCKECGEHFATRYFSVAYCSNHCRARKLQRDFGITWDPQKDQYENLGAERPLLIGPQAYQTLLEFCHRFLEQHDFVQIVADDTPLDEPHIDDPHTSLDLSPLESNDQVMSLPSKDPLPDSPFGASPFD